jgi:hypothetical protein
MLPIVIMRILLLTVFLPLTLFGQTNNSKEEDKYGGFKPTPVDEVRKFEKKYFRILTTDISYTEKTSDTDLGKMKMDISFLDPENLMKAAKDAKKRNEICRYSNGKGLTAILFLDSKYDEFMWGEPGYWIRIEDKNDSTDYYTGLAKNYYFKLFDSGSSIWKNEFTLQFPALRVRLVEPFIHPVRAPKYETIDNNLIIEIAVNDLRRDSDKDGLTDIEEDKLLLNPYSRDSDNDGKSDLEDNNPRFKSSSSNEALLYKAILDDFINKEIRIKDGKILDPKRPTLIHTLKRQTHLIVTDDKDLQSVEFDYNQFIIMTGDEYRTYKQKYPISLNEITVTPMSRVDNNNKYFISTYTDLGGQKYLVTKLKDGYNITMYEHWIH